MEDSSQVRSLMSRRVPGKPAGQVSGSRLFWDVPWCADAKCGQDTISSVTARQIPLPPSSLSPAASALVVHSIPPQKCRDDCFRRPTLLLALTLRRKGQLPRVGIIRPVKELVTPTRTTTPSKKRTRAKMKTFSPMYPPPPPTSSPAFRPQFSIPLPAHSMIRLSQDMYPFQHQYSTLLSLPRIQVEPVPTRSRIYYFCINKHSTLP